MSLLADLNARYTTSAFRFEVLRPSPDSNPTALRSIHNDPYLLRVAQHVLDGKRRDRVLVVEELTPTMLALLDPYRANVAVGEVIAVATADALGDSYGDDFWLFDEDTDHPEAVVMHYGDDGRVVDREHIADRAAALRLLRGRASIARAAGVSLGAFLAIHTVHGDRCVG